MKINEFPCGVIFQKAFDFLFEIFPYPFRSCLRCAHGEGSIWMNVD